MFLKIILSFCRFLNKFSKFKFLEYFVTNVDSTPRQIILISRTLCILHVGPAYNRALHSYISEAWVYNNCLLIIKFHRFLFYFTSIFVNNCEQPSEIYLYIIYLLFIYLLSWIFLCWASKCHTGIIKYC